MVQKSLPLLYSPKNNDLLRHVLHCSDVFNNTQLALMSGPATDLLKRYIYWSGNAGSGLNALNESAQKVSGRVDI
jgi:hypothetical protein